MEPKKCLACGSKNIIRFNAIVLTEGDCNIHSYACADCGFVMSFANRMDVVQNHMKSKIEDDNKRKIIGSQIDDNINKIANNKCEINMLESKIQILKAKADDDNITVKEQKAYLSEIAALEKQIVDLMGEVEDANKRNASLERQYKDVGRGPMDDYIS